MWPAVRRRIGECLLAGRVAIFLLWLPFRLRYMTLPRLLDRLGRDSRRWPGIPPPDHERAAAIVGRVCRARLFRLACFPRACLREALALYDALKGPDPDIRLHLGVFTDRGLLHAHSWVSRHGRPIGPGEPCRRFRILYSYPNDRDHVRGDQ
jgi:hypothetical protein